MVTADAELVTADAKTNSDLFWALKGGGPGTFGVVTGATVKPFPEAPSFSMMMSISGSGESFWNAVTLFHNNAPAFANGGAYIWFALTNTFLTVQPFVAPHMTRADFEEVRDFLLSLFFFLSFFGLLRLLVKTVPNPMLTFCQIVNPFLNSLSEQFTNEVQEWPTFYELYKHIRRASQCRRPTSCHRRTSHHHRGRRTKRRRDRRGL